MADNAVSAPPERPDGLQIEEDRKFQLRFWRIQRLGWGAFAVVLLAALTGLTGSGGPWSEGHLLLAEGELRYPAVARWDARAQWSVTFDRVGSRRQLLLAGDLDHHFVVETIQPQPMQSYLTTDGQLLEFASDGAPPHRVVLTLRAWRPGIARGRVAVNGTSADFTTLILP